jgi:hypothetical protein
MFFWRKEMRRPPVTSSLEERLLKTAGDARARAKELEPGAEQDLLLAKARQFESQISMNGFFIPATESRLLKRNNPNGESDKNGDTQRHDAN